VSAGLAACPGQRRRTHPGHQSHREPAGEPGRGGRLPDRRRPCGAGRRVPARRGCGGALQRRRAGHGRQVIAVTGATGAIGGAVARHLYDAGAAQRLVVRNPGRASRLSGVPVAAASYGDTPALLDAFDGTDTLLDFTFLRDNLYLDAFPYMVGDDGVIRGPSGAGRGGGGGRARPPGGPPPRRGPSRSPSPRSRPRSPRPGAGRFATRPRPWTRPTGRARSTAPPPGRSPAGSPPTRPSPPATSTSSPPPYRTSPATARPASPTTSRSTHADQLLPSGDLTSGRHALRVLVPPCGTAYPMR
jgi:hypothetical protein